MFCLFIHLEGNTSFLDMTGITRIAVSFHCETHNAFVTHFCQATVVTNVEIVIQKLERILNKVWWGVLLNF